MTRNVSLAITFTIWPYVEVSFSPLFSLLLICPLITFPLFFPSLSNVIVVCFLDCKIVRICAYSGTCKQSNKRSGTRLRITHFARVRLLRHALPISILILREKTDCFEIYFFPEVCYCVLEVSL